MEIRRTANAGVLLNLDDVCILLDGVCQEVKPYLATPQSEKCRLSDPWPDAAAFTHIHEDHFDPAFARSYCIATGKQIFSVAQAEQFLPGCVCTQEEYSVGSLRLSAVQTRHMGRAYADAQHRSFVVQGSRCVWFLGDAAPQQLKLLSVFPKPDVLIVPFPYVSTESAIRQIEEFLPAKIVLIHMPLRSNDPDGLWEMVAPAIEKLGQNIYCPQIGENLTL